MGDGYLNSERLQDHRLKNTIQSMGRRNLSHLSDDYSNAGSDMDDEDITEPPNSPIGPLSLTTNDRKGSPRSHTPQNHTPEIKIENLSSSEPKDEPVNYHSPSNQSNNNKMTDDEDETDYSDNKPNEVNDEGILRPHRICSSPDVDGQLLHRPDGLERLAASFPLVPNSMFSHSIMYMSQYIPGLTHTAASPPGASALNMSALTADERRKRNRTFIDPVTEVPRLEQWFSLNTHPSHNLILKYTEELNCMAYRQKFPRLEPKNVQFWFKNRRAKCKRLKMSLFDSQSSGHYHHGEKE